MNTSLKGASYERAYVRLLRSRGYIATRTPFSQSPFDVWAVLPGLGLFVLVQLKNDGRGCESALRLATALRNRYPGIRVDNRIFVVHPTKEERFCEH